MTKLISPTQIIDTLVRAYEKHFGGKTRGRFTISRILLRELSKRGHLEEILHRLINLSYMKGFLLLDLGDIFGFIDLNLCKNWRQIPRSILSDTFSEDDDNSDDSEDDDDSDDSDDDDSDDSEDDDDSDDDDSDYNWIDMDFDNKPKKISLLDREDRLGWRWSNPVPSFKVGDRVVVLSEDKTSFHLGILIRLKILVGWVNLDNGENQRVRLRDDIWGFASIHVHHTAPISLEEVKTYIVKKEIPSLPKIEEAKISIPVLGSVEDPHSIINRKRMKKENYAKRVSMLLQVVKDYSGVIASSLPEGIRLRFNNPEKWLYTKMAGYYRIFIKSPSRKYEIKSRVMVGTYFKKGYLEDNDFQDLTDIYDFKPEEVEIVKLVYTLWLTSKAGG